METETAAVAEIVKQNLRAEIASAERGTHEKTSFLVLPEGLEIASLKKVLDEYLPHPEHKEGTSTHRTLESFVTHVQRFKNPDAIAQSVLFGSWDDQREPILQCVYDYNEPGEGRPRWRRYRARYVFPVSDEWKTWTEIAGNQMVQQEFAEFLEDHVHDVIPPDDAGENALALAETLGTTLATPAQLMALSRGLTIHIGQRVINATNLSTGEAQIAFGEELADQQGQPLRIPAAFAIAIPVFEDGGLWQLPIRLRYRHQGGRITWILQPHRVAETFRAVFTQACDAAQEATELPLFFGQPEP